MNKVIVIGGDHHNTLGVIRGLGERGIYPDLVLVGQEKRTFVDASKYIRRVFRVDQDADAVQLLIAQYGHEEEKPVVICCSDASSGAMDENLDVLRPNFFLPSADQQGRISELMNKKRMAELAQEVGLNVPATWYEDAPEIAVPCIIKPLVSRKGKKEDIHICRTKEQLADCLATCDRDNIQVQAFIDKDFEYQLIGCSTRTDVIIPGVSKILRPCKGSNTSFLHYIPLEEGFCEIEKCREFVRRTGYHGLFSMEFLRDKNGRDHFMEINFRNDGNAICVTAAGVSLPHIWYLSCLGEDYSAEMSRPIRPVYVMPDMAELKLLLTGQITPGQYFGDLKKTDRFMERDKEDKKPFRALIKKTICRKSSI